MKTTKWAGRAIFVLLLLSSLTLNGAMFVGGSMYKIESSAFEFATGITSIATKHDKAISDLDSQLVQERRAKLKAQSELSEAVAESAAQRRTIRQLRQEAAEASTELAAQKSIVRRVRAEAADPLLRTVTFRGQRMAAREVVETTTQQISRRPLKSSGREIASIAAESVPYVGIAAIVGVTALELKDLCDTIKDMSAFREALDPLATENPDEKTVCTVRVPTQEEVWATIKDTPQAAWSASLDAVPTWDEVQSIKWPELPEFTFEGTWDGLQSSWTTTKTVASDTVDAVTSTTNQAVDGVLDWLSTEDSEKIE